MARLLRTTVLEACHGGTGSGHFGVTKTLHRLWQSYYWGLQRRDMEDFCCEACASYKRPLDQSCVQLQQQPAGALMEMVAVEIMGPFPHTEQGKRYVLTATLPSGRRPMPSQIKRLRPWQMPYWRGCLAVSAQTGLYTATRAIISNQRCSLPCASTLGCRNLAQQLFTPRVMV